MLQGATVVQRKFSVKVQTLQEGEEQYTSTGVSHVPFIVPTYPLTHSSYQWTERRWASHFHWIGCHSIEPHPKNINLYYQTCM